MAAAFFFLSTSKELVDPDDTFEERLPFPDDDEEDDVGDEDEEDEDEDDLDNLDNLDDGDVGASAAEDFADFDDEDKDEADEEDDDDDDDDDDDEADCAVSVDMSSGWMRWSLFFALTTLEMGVRHRGQSLDWSLPVHSMQRTMCPHGRYKASRGFS